PPPRKPGADEPDADRHGAAPQPVVSAASVTCSMTASTLARRAPTYSSPEPWARTVRCPAVGVTVTAPLSSTIPCAALPCIQRTTVTAPRGVVGSPRTIGWHEPAPSASGTPSQTSTLLHRY